MADGKVCARKLTKKTLVIENSPIVTLWVLTSLLLIQIHWLWLLLFFVYVPFSVVWQWRYICTHCAAYGTGCCPSGYGNAAAKLFLFRGEKGFRKAFSKNIPVVFGYWFIPLIGGIYLLYISYPDIPIILIMLFVSTLVVGFGVAPYISSRVGCKECVQRDDCPWVKSGGSPKKHTM